MTDQGRVSQILERRYVVPFLVVASLFFSWALASSLNDVLIRHFQKALSINRGQSGFIQFAFYIGYFCAALPAGWLMRRTSYKVGILCGLALYCVGALAFWPAAILQSFPLFLAGLYIIAFGAAFLETAANPYMAALGDPATGPSRLNLAQSFNGLGAIVGPFIGGLFILSGVEYSPMQIASMAPAAERAYRAAEAQAVVGPYLGLAAFVAILFVLVAVTALPNLDADNRSQRSSLLATFRHKHLSAAVVAQFFYVGAQVAIWSYFIDFAKEMAPELSERTVAFLLSASLGAFLVGRLSGSWLFTRIPAPRLLIVYGVANIGLCALAGMSSGMQAIGALWLTSFFMSIMFPTIFALGVRDLGPDTKTGSSLLIMSIIGGALMPVAMGYVADAFGGLRPALILPSIGFAAVIWFGAIGWRLDRA